MVTLGTSPASTAGGALQNPMASQAATAINSNQLVNQLMNVKDSRWLQLEVCREFQRGQCSRSDLECKFAHPPPHVDIQNGRVTACYDSIKGRCTRENPKCKYLHPPHHLKDQLLVNGKHNLALKNLICSQLAHGAPPGIPIAPLGQFGQIGLPQSTQPSLVQPLPYQYYAGLTTLYPPIIQPQHDPYAAQNNANNNGIPCKRPNIENKNCTGGTGTTPTAPQTANVIFPQQPHQAFNPYLLQHSIPGYVPAVSFSVAGPIPPRY